MVGQQSVRQSWLACLWRRCGRPAGPDLTQPAFAFGLDEAGFEDVADLFEPGALRRIRSQERASLASMLMDAGRVSACIAAMGASRPV